VRRIDRSGGDEVGRIRRAAPDRSASVIEVAAMPAPPVLLMPAAARFAVFWFGWKT